MKTNFNLQSAKHLLLSQNLTLVLYNGQGEIITSSKRGVAPLLELIDYSKDLSGFHAVDRVVGSASAFLYCILRVKSVHALVASEGAVKILSEHNILLDYQTLTNYIINREGDGKCPMENAVEHCKSEREALNKIREKLAQLNS